MKRAMCILWTLLIAGFASAESINVDDDATGGNSYGNCAGFAIDFDTTAPLAAASITTGWEPVLTDGGIYALNSISMGAITPIGSPERQRRAVSLDEPMGWDVGILMKTIDDI